MSLQRPTKWIWVVTLSNLGYLLFDGALLVDDEGRRCARKHLLYSIGLYSTIGALGCFLSPHNLQSLLAARLILMGFGGGAFLVRAVILAGMMFPNQARSAAVTLALRRPVSSSRSHIRLPLAGSRIESTGTTRFSWIFPFLLLGAYLVWTIIPKNYLFRRKREKPDIRGAFFLITALSCLQLATSRSERDRWFDSDVDYGMIIASVVFAALYIWWDTRDANAAPVFHLRMIWRQAAVRTSFGIVLIVGSILSAGLTCVAAMPSLRPVSLQH